MKKGWIFLLTVGAIGGIAYVAKKWGGKRKRSFASSTFASSIEEFTPGDPIFSEAPIENILGSPRKAERWQDVLGAIGYGGQVVVGFDPPIVNGPGNDVLFWFGGFRNEHEQIEAFRVEAKKKGGSFVKLAEFPYRGHIPVPVPLTPFGADLDKAGLDRADFLRIIDLKTGLACRGLELNAIEGRARRR